MPTEKKIGPVTVKLVANADQWSKMWTVKLGAIVSAVGVLAVAVDQVRALPAFAPFLPLWIHDIFRAIEIFLGAAIMVVRIIYQPNIQTAAQSADDAAPAEPADPKT